MKHTLTRKLTVVGAAAALALGVAACEIEEGENGDVDNVQDDPILDDGLDEGIE